MLKVLVAPQTAGNYFPCSNDMEITLKSKRLWRFETAMDCEQAGLVDEHRDESDSLGNVNKVQKRDLALAHIMCTVDTSIKGMVRTVRCPSEAWGVLRGTFCVVSEASIDAILSKL